MFIQGMHGYVPVDNIDENGEIKDIVFTIYGSAMENLPQNNNNGVNFNIALTELVPSMGLV